MNETVALVDDHVMLRKGLVSLLTDLGYQVLLDADNGKQFIEKLNPDALPQVVLMDITMPLMNGYDTTLWLKKNHPAVNVIALSMLDDETAIIKMIRNGARGYLLKDSHPDELQKAINAVLETGFYQSELVNDKLVESVRGGITATTVLSTLTDRELELLKWTCTELSYKEIAHQMNISPRTVDSHRDALQEKLECKGRVGLMLWAIKNNIVTL